MARNSARRASRWQRVDGLGGVYVVQASACHRAAQALSTLKCAQRARQRQNRNAAIRFRFSSRFPSASQPSASGIVCLPLSIFQSEYQVVSICHLFQSPNDHASRIEFKNPLPQKLSSLIMAQNSRENISPKRYRITLIPLLAKETR